MVDTMKKRRNHQEGLLSSSSTNMIHSYLKQQRTAKPWYYDFQRRMDSIQMLQSTTILANPPNQPSCGCVNAMAFSWDYTHIASGCDNSMVQLWNIGTKKCVKTLFGHSSNVFSVLFNQPGIDEIVSGGNDADIRIYNLQNDQCTVITHFYKKVLSMCRHRNLPSTVIACSSDGTVRLFDSRVKYSGSFTQDIAGLHENGYTRNVLPQALGGGRSNQYARYDEMYTDSLLLNYRKCSRRYGYDLYSVDIHPLNGNQIIVGSAMGDVRLFDIRKIADYNALDYVNIYKNVTLKGNEVQSESNDVTGCQFSYNGKQIVATFLNDLIYVFDTEQNYSKEYNIDYFNGFLNASSNSSASSSHEDEQSSSEEEQEEGWRPLIFQTRDRENIMTDEDSDSDEEIEMFIDRYRAKRAQKEDEEEYMDTIKNTTSVSEERIIHTYERVFEGHVSQATIKGVSFYGDRSQYVISGSDDGYIFIWETDTGKLVRILQAHEETVNTVCCSKHPTTVPMIVTSGIDDYIHIWTPEGDYPSQDELDRRQRIINNISEENKRETIASNQHQSNDTGLLDILRHMYMEYYVARNSLGISTGLSDSSDNDDDEEEEEPTM
jgi:WD40 repeat protein